MFNWAIRRPIAKSRVSGKGGSEDETWVEDYWQGGVTDEYSKLKDNLDLNPGQRAILESEQDLVIDYLFEIDKDYDPGEFLQFLSTSLTDNKYEALSITWEEYSITCEDIWDNAYGGDGYDTKKFLGMRF